MAPFTHGVELASSSLPAAPSSAALEVASG